MNDFMINIFKKKEEARKIVIFHFDKILEKIQAQTESAMAPLLIIWVKLESSKFSEGKSLKLT